MADVDQILVERQKTHGHYSDHAMCAQELKEVIRRHLKYREDDRRSGLTHCQIESLEMIAHKIGRIISGDASFQDHWDDIAGYAKIANYKRS